jgi:hypothetical protein
MAVSKKAIIILAEKDFCPSKMLALPHQNDYVE